MIEPEKELYEQEKITAENQLKEAEKVQCGAAETTDDLLQKKDVYQTVKLADCLKGQEENFASFKKLAAELNLPAEAVQKLMDWEANVGLEAKKKRNSTRGEILQKWTQQTKEMLGPKYQQEIGRALRAVEQFGGEELRQLLDATGLGNHPTIVKTFHGIAQCISEDHSIGAVNQKRTDKTFAEALYGKAD